MSERLRNILIVGLLGVMAAVLVTLVATSPSDADRVQSIGTRIRCPVCQGESIANSPSQLAQDMMSLIRERVDSGESDSAIIDEILASYSGAVLLDPPVGGSTLLLWLAPLLALAIGIGVILWWRRHPTKDESVSEPEQRSVVRRLAPVLALAAAFAVIVVVAGFSLQDKPSPSSGVADLSAEDLANVSNETMEAVIAENADNPQIDGMRLALAERYYQEGDFQKAFPHYLAVAESPDASKNEVVTALLRLGWMAWQGNGEVDAALHLFDQALAIDAGSDTVRYLKAQVLWCGSNDPEAAAKLLNEVLADPGLDSDSRTSIEADLADIDAGKSCQ